MATIEREQLCEWEKQLTNEVDALRLRKAELELELQRCVRKLELVRQMLAVEEGRGDAAQQNSADTPPLRPTSVTVRESAKRVLEDSGKPLHISEIYQEFLRRGYPIPGSGTPFNILTHMVRDKGFVRVARGTYALSGSGSLTQVVPFPKKRKRRRRRARQPKVSTA